MKKANLFYVLLIGLTLLSNTLLSISFDEIEVWIGEGENQAGLIIDWEDELAPTTLAWGYRWDGVKNGQEMLMEVMAAAPRLSGDGGLPLYMAYDLNNDGTIDTADHNANGDMSDGNYWAYYTSAHGSDWNYGTTNHAGRTLVDGEWDGWLFIADWAATPYPEIDEAIPAPAPTTAITFEDIEYWVGTGSSQAMMIIDWQTDAEVHSYAWGYNFTVLTDATEMITDIAADDARLNVEWQGSFVKKLTFDADLDGTPEYTAENGDDGYWNSFKKNDTGWITAGNMSTVIEAEERFGFAYGILDNYNILDNATAVSVYEPVEELTFDELIVWAGEGENEAMFVADFNTGDDPQSYAWGYRWDGEADGTAMMTALSELDPRITVTLASGFLTDITLDIDNDGTVDYGVYEETDYWSTWSKPETGDWNWNSGCGTVLENNARFGCSYGFTPESTQPDNPVAMSEIPFIDTELPFTDLIVWAGEGSNEAMLVVDFNAGDDPQSYAWGYRWDGEADGTAMMTALSELDPRLVITLGGGFLTNIELDIDNDGIVDYGVYEETDYWSTWSRGEASDWSWNSGCGTVLENNARFGCSYGFTPESTQPDNPVAMPELPATNNIDFSIIEFWIGEGENEAAMVVDWSDDNEPVSMIWGYRWDGEKSCLDMFNAVIEADANLDCELTPGLLNGISYDINGDGTLDSNDHNQSGNGSTYWSIWSDHENDGWSSAYSMTNTILVDGGLEGFSWAQWLNETAPRSPQAAPIVIDNEAPVANNESTIVKNTVNNLLPILLNDVDADDNMDFSTIVISEEASHGTVILNEDGTITYSSEAGYEGEDSFSYTVADSLGAVSNVAVCNLTVVTPFSGVVGTDGCEAIAADSEEFVGWATGITLDRGFMDISDESAGYVTYGTEDNALGQAEGTSMNVVSLGDGGNAILTFEEAICDEEGADFAIFENSFSTTFLELAFVEVSSDGENFFRFPATSYTQLFTQITDSDAILAEDINNLAGKYIQGYGTPFDLAELAGTDGLDVDQITHVKIIDAVGAINPDYATYDAQGTIVNEPWPTVSASGGFDLDGVGVIHQTPIVSSPDTPELVMELKNSYPNPFMPGKTRAGVQIAFSLVKAQNVNVKIYNVKGQQVATVCDRKFGEGNNTVSWNGKDKHGDTASSGIYFYRMETENFKQTKRLMIIK